MRDDVDPHKPVVRLHLVNRNTYKYANGTMISEGDRNGYRLVMKTGETRCFMALNPGDMSHDWLDITDDVRAGRYIVSEREMAIPNLHTSEVEDLTSELRRHGRSLDEFDVLATPQKLADQSGGISATRGTVTVRNRKSKAERTYETGHASKWLIAFGDDLKAHAI